MSPYKTHNNHTRRTKQNNDKTETQTNDVGKKQFDAPKIYCAPRAAQVFVSDKNRKFSFCIKVFVILIGNIANYNFLSVINASLNLLFPLLMLKIRLRNNLSLCVFNALQIDASTA